MSGPKKIRNYMFRGVLDRPSATKGQITYGAEASASGAVPSQLAPDVGASRYRREQGRQRHSSATPFPKEWLCSYCLRPRRAALDRIGIDLSFEAAWRRWRCRDRFHRTEEQIGGASILPPSAAAIVPLLGLAAALNDNRVARRANGVSVVVPLPADVRRRIAGFISRIERRRTGPAPTETPPHSPRLSAAMSAPAGRLLDLPSG
jgi:hypothetical protein